VIEKAWVYKIDWVDRKREFANVVVTNAVSVVVDVFILCVENAGFLLFHHVSEEFLWCRLITK